MHPVKDELPWYYADKLQWQRKGDIVKAKPKRRLSMAAHNTILRAFRRYGGRFVSNHGEHYFELIQHEVAPSNSKVAIAFRELEKNGIFKQIEREEDYRG